MEEKSKFNFDEMCEMFVKDYPYFIPNRRNVGAYAKRKGFVLCKQKINKKQIYFYVPQSILK